ncbi:MAG: hypothetical protein GHCLOJNM_01538 [bacterium]|nr:hypothetical protein [bacterium]
MQFPVLAKEFRLALRGRQTFRSAFLLYAGVTLLTSMFWLIANEEGLGWRRETYSRFLFLVVVFGGGVMFCFHACVMASRILVVERETKTSSLLRTAPIRPSSLVFQKIATPIFLEWLLLFGLLPVLSLVFLLGGVGFSEFILQLANLGVCLNTSVLVGAVVSSLWKSSSKAAGNALAILWGVGVGLPLVPTLFESLGTALPFLLGGRFLEGHLIYMCELLAWATYPLSCLSPFWLAGSVYIMDPSGFYPFPADELMGIVPDCPPFVGWMLHLVLQGLLFLLAVRGWKRITEEADVAPEVREVRGVRGFLRWLRRGRVRRGHFPESWRACTAQEDRALFKKGWAEKGFFAVVVVALLVSLFRYVSGSGRDALVVLINSLISTTFVPTLLFSGVLATYALRREKTRDTGVLLLVTPQPAKALVFGKWLFYQLLVVAVLVAACALVCLGTLFVSYALFLGPISFRFLELVPYYAVFIPLVTIIGLYSGLSRYRSGLLSRVLIPAGMFYFLFIIVLNFFGGSRNAWLWEWLVTFIRDILGLGLLNLTALSLVMPWGIAPSEPEWKRPCRIALGLMTFVLVGYELLGDVSDEWKIKRLVLATPLCIAWLIWLRLASRPTNWWVRALLEEHKGI